MTTFKRLLISAKIIVENSQQYCKVFIARRVILLFDYCLKRYLIIRQAISSQFTVVLYFCHVAAISLKALCIFWPGYSPCESYFSYKDKNNRLF